MVDSPRGRRPAARVYNAQPPSDNRTTNSSVKLLHFGRDFQVCKAFVTQTIRDRVAIARTRARKAEESKSRSDDNPFGHQPNKPTSPFDATRDTNG